MKHLFLALLVACDAGKPAPVAAIRVDARMPDAALADAATPDAPPDAEPIPELATTLSPDDLAFQRAAIAYARERHRFLSGWGTIRFAGEPAIRTATFMNFEFHNDSRGAYILELAPHRYVEVLFTCDGRTQAFGGGDGVEHPVREVAWHAYDESRIDHTAGHHHGGETFSFGVHRGSLVLFDYGYVDDVTDKEDRLVVHEGFADATSGACTKRCPPLAKHVYRDSRLAVSEEARSIAALVDPAMPDWPDDPR